MSMNNSNCKYWASKIRKKKKEKQQGPKSERNSIDRNTEENQDINYE